MTTIAKHGGGEGVEQRHAAVPGEEVAHWRRPARTPPSARRSARACCRAPRPPATGRRWRRTACARRLGRQDQPQGEEDDERGAGTWNWRRRGVRSSADGAGPTGEQLGDDALRGALADLVVGVQDHAVRASTGSAIALTVAGSTNALPSSSARACRRASARGRRAG